ncbi:hypothetical protein [Cohnella thermotolerans]|uniref:hypothetical protein n=1 Tax=Cohnella thermotolerans TaxID=329858 RepID=UPI0012EC3F35|nr:hypothetical protein [Cohnella thermotolerans]
MTLVQRSPALRNEVKRIKVLGSDEAVRTIQGTTVYLNSLPLTPKELDAIHISFVKLKEQQDNEPTMKFWS